MRETCLLRIQVTKIRTYLELRRLETFEERFEYLKLSDVVGERTFGFDRWINQRFYHSQEWKTIRNHVISRDNGCDLGVLGYELHSGLLIHHMNPVTLDDIKHSEYSLINPDFLITTSLQTHNAIHYGDESLLPRGPVVRERGDTTLW
jgi:hypothetical protein